MLRLTEISLSLARWSSFLDGKRGLWIGLQVATNIDQCT